MLFKLDKNMGVKLIHKFKTLQSSACFNMSRVITEDSDDFLKILMIGDSNVGKTSILKRFVDGRAYNMEDIHIATIGVDFKIRTIIVDGKAIKLQIWDTAGQERFHSILPQYYRNAQGVIVVYDVTVQSTFDNVTNIWLKQLEQNIPDLKEEVSAILVGNKRDLSERRKVESAEASEIADKLGMKFLETSAHNGYNIEDTFTTMVKDIIQRRKLKRKRQDIIIIPDPTRPEPNCC